MSANVWFEEVNVGLLNELKSSIKIKTGRKLVSLNSDAFMVRKPEDEFMVESFPCVSIYTRSYSYDRIRYNPSPVKIGEDEEHKQVILEKSAIPYELTYQIDFWARYQTDMDYMTRTWLVNHFHHFNLDVKDDNGVERSCMCLAKGDIIRADLVSDGKRLFHSIISYTIRVELDDETRYNEPMVIDRKISINEQEVEDAENN